MKVRAKIALTIFLTGLFTALGVVFAIVLAYERFEHESAYYRADAFLKRVVVQHPDLLGMRERFGEDFSDFLSNLVLYEPDTQLYLLDTQGTVLSSTGKRRWRRASRCASSRCWRPRATRRCPMCSATTQSAWTSA